MAIELKKINNGEQASVVANTIYNNDDSLKKAIEAHQSSTKSHIVELTGSIDLVTVSGIYRESGLAPHTYFVYEESDKYVQIKESADLISQWKRSKSKNAGSAWNEWELLNNLHQKVDATTNKAISPYGVMIALTDIRSKMMEAVKSDNLFRPILSMTGWYMDMMNDMTYKSFEKNSSGGYKLSGYQKVDPNTTYYITGYKMTDRKWGMYYDANLNPIGTKGFKLDGNPITTPEGCVYILFTISTYNHDISEIQIATKQGLEYTAYKAPSVADEYGLIRDLDITESINFDINLYDQSMINASVNIDDKGNVGSYGWYGAYIPVNELAEYSIYHNNGVWAEAAVGRLAYCDADKNIIQTLNMLFLPDTVNGKRISTPKNCAYVLKNMRISSSTDYRSDFKINPFVISKIQGKDIVSINSGGNGGSGSAISHIAKKLVLMGDSNTDSSVTTLASRLDNFITFDSKINYARSGATWSHTANTTYNITATGGNTTDENVIWNQINKLISQVSAGAAIPDIIVINCGTNDALNSRVMGNIETAFDRSVAYNTLQPNDTKVQNVAGAMRYCLDKLYRTYPNVQIYLTTPIYSNKTWVPLLYEVHDIIEGAANRMSTDFIDILYRSGITPFFTNDHDGLHLKDSGSIRVARYIAGEIKRLYA